jgi:hypothetical protein
MEITAIAVSKESTAPLEIAQVPKIIDSSEIDLLIMNAKNIMKS